MREKIWHIATKEWCQEYRKPTLTPMIAWPHPMTLCGLARDTWQDHNPDIMTNHPAIAPVPARRLPDPPINCEACILLLFQEEAENA
jgi:hypothetical protein